MGSRGAGNRSEKVGKKEMDGWRNGISGQFQALGILGEHRGRDGMSGRDTEMKRCGWMDDNGGGFFLPGLKPL